jgi:hypothetical protein
VSQSRSIDKPPLANKHQRRTHPNHRQQTPTMPFETKPRTERFKIEQTPGTDHVFYSKSSFK